MIELWHRHVNADARPQITPPKFPMLQIVVPFQMRTADQTLNKILGVDNTGVLFSNRQRDKSHSRTVVVTTKRFAYILEATARIDHAAIPRQTAASHR